MSEGMKKLDQLLFAIVGAAQSFVWWKAGWTKRETSRSSPEGTGWYLICPEGHKYWGRGPKQAEAEIEKRRDEAGKLSCSHCEEVGRQLHLKAFW
jgi:hypothetical protein